MADSDDHALLLQISFDLQRLKKQADQAGGVLDKGLSDMERRAKKAAKQVEDALSFSNVKPSAAINNVLLGLKSDVVGGATAQLGAFGAALEALGPIGIAAGAGVAAAGFAIANAMKSADWAEDLKRASETLGLTTTQLQEFDFVFQAMGIDVARGRETLSGLEKTIGLVMEGAARKQQLAQFVDVLKITPDQLRGWGTLEQQLPRVIDAFARLDPEERAATASRLKVDPEVINSFVMQREEITKLIDKFHEYGLNISSDVIDKSAAMASEIHADRQIIDGELRKSFIELEPAIVGAAAKLVDMARNLADFIGGVRDALTPIGDLITALNNIPRDIAIALHVSMPDGLSKQVNDAVYDSMPIIGGIRQGIGQAMARGRQLDEQRQFKGAFADTSAAAYGPAQPHPQQRVPTTAGGHKGAGAAPHDDTAETADTVNRDLADADKRLQEALKALTSNVEARAAFEAAAIEDERKTQIAGIEKERQKILQDQTITGANAQIMDAKLRAAEDAINEEAAAKQKLLATQTAQAKTDQANALSDLGREGQQQLLEAQKALAKTGEQRRAIALKLFELEEELEEAKLQEVIASKTTTEYEKQRAAAELANLQATKSLRAQAVSNSNPANSWDAKLQELANETGDVSEEFAKLKVDALDTFNSSLFNASGGLNNLGDVAKSVIRKLDTDIEQQALKTLESAAFGNGQGQGGFLGNILTKLGIPGFGGKGAAGAKPTGTAMDPIYVASADSSGGLGGLFGGQGGSGGGIFSQIMGMFGLGGSGAGAGAAGSGGISLSDYLSFGGYAEGGSFIVGGRGGIDKNIAMLRVTAGERVTVETSAQQRTGGLLGGSRHATVNITTPNADSFRKSQRQVIRSTRQALGVA